MQVTLKQSEIESALKGYIAQQGINLNGKEVSISFTAGRKESGISAEIDIEDANLTSYTAPLPVEAPLHLLKIPAEVIPMAAVETVTETVVEAQEEVVDTPKTSSLFG